MTDARAEAPPAEPVLFQIQLVEVHCAEIAAARKQKSEAAEEEGGVTLGVTGLDEARRTFRARLNVKVVAPAPADDEVAELLAVVQGTFSSEGEVPDELYKRYIEFTPIALLWPYARAYIAQSAQMIGLNIPPLPSLDTFGMAEQTKAATEA